MNAPTSAPIGRPTAVKRLAVLRRDSDFLPAALEILETPPSPTTTAVLFTICACVTAALVWGYFGHVDIIASAHGKFQPTGRVKVIQPVETGKVERVVVHNGQEVRQGEVVVQLDAAEAQADEATAAAGDFSFRAEVLRRKAALAAAERPALGIVPVDWPSDFPQVNREREDRVLAGDINQLRSALGSFNAQIRQKQAEQKRLSDTIVAQKALIDVLQQRVDMRATLVASGAGPLTNLIDAKENLNYHSANLATAKGQLEESIAGLDVLTSDKAKALGTFVADNRQKLADAERQADDFAQRLAKARAHLARLTLTSPISGTVSATTITAPGQVVTTGEEVVRIVPSDAALEIEGYIENRDIGFVKAGQEAVVKIESFPFTRYGAIAAKVTRVATDAIPDQDAQQIEGDPAKSTKSSGYGGAQRTQNLVFPVTLAPETTSMVVGDATIPLSTGMAVTVEIKTGSRRLLEYLFSPLVETASRALKER